MIDRSKNLIREENSKALLNSDIAALEEHKFKKGVLRDINNFRKELDILRSEVETLKTENHSLREELKQIKDN